MNNHIMNLTTVEELSLTNTLKEIWVFDTIKKPIRSILANLDSNEALNALYSCIEGLIKAQNCASNAFSEGNVSIKNVALIVDVTECEPKSILALNTFYQTFDINNIKPLLFLAEIKEYGETLDFPFYDFFQLALKCMCMVNTRISLMNSCPRLISDSEYNEQDFLALIKQITKEKAFTLEIDGYSHKIDCTQDGRVKVDGEPIILLSDLIAEMAMVVVNMYKKQPNQFCK